MKTIKTSLLAAALMAVTAPAFANVTMVTCIGYVVSMSDEAAIRGQALAGSVAGFERVVCERSAAMSDVDEATVTPVFIEELGITSRIGIFPIDDE